MSGDEKAVVLFHSTSHAIQAERILTKASISCTMIPLPRHLSSDCGICLEFRSCDGRRVADELKKRDVSFEGPVSL